MFIRKGIMIFAAIIAIGWCESAAEDGLRGKDTAESDSNVFSGEISPLFRSADIDGDSAKFNEYTDWSQPVTGDATVSYLQPNRYALRFNGTQIGADDQDLNFLADWYGRLSVDLSYDKIVHRLADDARTLYTGLGSGYLAIDNGIQDTLAPLTQEALVAQLNTFYEDAFSFDPVIFRKRLKLKTDLVAYKPFSLKVEISRENRDGSKPMMGSFGLSDPGVDPPVEIVEPIDSDTTQIKLLGEYFEDSFFVNLSYYYSQYENKQDAVTFENPFNRIDSIFDPSAGRIALAPDNRYHYLSLSGGHFTLPFKSRLTGGLSLGRMTQNDDLLPYSINTSLTSPFDATNPANLPQRNPDARVDTTLCYLQLVSNPIHVMRLKGNFRYTDYDNDTDKIRFPGYVNNDDLFIPIEIVTSPISYRHLTAGTEMGLSLFPRTRFTLGYLFDQTRRTHSQVDRENENTIKASVDAFAWEWTDLRITYKRSYRDIGKYDETVGSSTQLPQLRKYTMADRVQDRIELTANVYPKDSIVLSGSIAYGKDDFTDSPFGLQNDENFVASMDADWSISKKVSIFGAFIHERYKADQIDSEDTLNPELFRWAAETKDTINTLAGGINLTFIPKRLDASLSYTYAVANGEIDLSSAAVSPLDFQKSDDSVQHALLSKLNYHMKNGISLTLGHLWKKFDYDDFDTAGFAYVSANASNPYDMTLVEGLFMGTLPKDYDAHVLYLKMTCSF